MQGPRLPKPIPSIADAERFYVSEHRRFLQGFSIFAHMWRTFGSSAEDDPGDVPTDPEDPRQPGGDLSQGYLAPGMGAPGKQPTNSGYLAPGMEPPPQHDSGPSVGGVAKGASGGGGGGGDGGDGGSVGRSGSGGSRLKIAGWDGPIEQHPLKAAFLELQRLPTKLVEFFAWQRLAALRDVELGWQKLGDVKIAKAEKAAAERAGAPKLFPSANPV